MLPPCAIFKLKIHKNAYAAKLQISPDPITGFQGATSRQGMGGKRGRRKRKRKMEVDSVPPLLFFTNLTTAQQCIVAATYTPSIDL